MLSFTDIALRRGPTLLFENASLKIYRQQKTGLVGANGTGKTSFLKLILGELECDQGNVEIPSDLRIAHLAQEVAASDEAALHYVLGGDWELQNILAAIESAQSNEDYEKIAPLHEALEHIDGYAAKSRAEQLLAGLGFTANEVEQPLSAFSGGWRIRLNLARCLMTRSDLLLLDEPTNHLDLDAIFWLANWINLYQGAILLISHDREFLDETVDSIAYIQGQKIESFSGNYSQFEILKAARLAQQHSQHERQQAEIKHMQDFVRRFRAKATKARQAQSRVKALERMELIAPAHIDSPFRFSIEQADKTSDPLLALTNCDLGYADPILSEIKISLRPGDRIGLLGRNGAGKSTLLKTLSGELDLLAGERVSGSNLQIGYFSQHQIDDLDLAASALVHITRLDPNTTEQQVRNFLGGFNFHGDDVLRPINIFSGGEKARLALAIVTYRRPNLLLLDEPTNHLDIDMRQALTVALQDFGGAMVLISHDRHLLANSVDTFLLIRNGNIEPFDGTLDDYRAILSDSNKRISDLEVDPAPDPVKPNYRAAQQLATRVKTLESRLDRCHRKLADVELGLSDVDLYQEPNSGNLQNLLREQINLKEQIEETENEWLLVSEQIEAGKARVAESK
jgi:ATP-binding cassette subfamily F protein 3